MKADFMLASVSAHRAAAEFSIKGNNAMKKNEDHNHNPRTKRPHAARAIALISMIGLSTTLGGCLAAAVGAGAGVGYAVGHEKGEDHVQSGEHADDD